MNGDALFRAGAVALAVVLAVAPHRAEILAQGRRLVEAAKGHASLVGRLAAIALLIAAAWGKVPMPTLPSVPVVPVAVETPSVEMQQAVQPIAKALSALPMGDRMLWAQTWGKAATVAAGDAVTAETVFTDTRSLRLFTTLAIDIAWRRIGNHAPGSVAGLREAVEAAYGQAIGTDVVPVTADVRGRYVAFAKAVAWAGINGG